LVLQEEQHASGLRQPDAASSKIPNMKPVEDTHSHFLCNELVFPELIQVSLMWVRFNSVVIGK